MAEADNSDTAVRHQFQQLLLDITTQLGSSEWGNPTDMLRYHHFIEAEVAPLWDVASTARALLGQENYQSLSGMQRDELHSAVKTTLIRYAYLGLEYYSEQRFTIVDSVLNPQRGMGWLQVEIKLPKLPDFQFDMLIKRAPNQVWRAVDIRIQGITYVTIKKYQF